MITSTIELPNLSILVIALACFLTGVSKGGLGGTLGVLITPLVVMVLPYDKGLGLTLLMFMLGDVFALAVHWRRWESQLMGLLLAGGFVGVILGTFVLTSISPMVLRKGLGVFVLLYLAYRLSEWLFARRVVKNEAVNTEAEGRMAMRPYQSRKGWSGLLAGSVAGFTCTLANSGGPPLTVYLLSQRLEPRVFVATSVLFFTIMNWIKVPAFYYAGIFDFKLVLSLVWLAPLVPLGVWVGKRLVNRVDRKWFDRVIIALLMVAGVLLLVK